MDNQGPNRSLEQGSGPDTDTPRNRRQRAYRARLGEVTGLLGRLWLLRRSREAGGRSVRLQPARQWEEYAILLRQLVHEEERLAELTGRRSPEAGGEPAAGKGLSTCHIPPSPSLPSPDTLEADRNATPVVSRDATQEGNATHNATPRRSRNRKGKK